MGGVATIVYRAKHNLEMDSRMNFTYLSESDCYVQADDTQ